jgi:hypothetical protein
MAQDGRNAAPESNSINRDVDKAELGKVSATVSTEDDVLPGGRKPWCAGPASLIGGILCYIIFFPCVGICACARQIKAFLCCEKVVLENPNSTTPLELVRQESSGEAGVENMSKPGRGGVEKMRRELIKRGDSKSLVTCGACGGTGKLQVDGCPDEPAQCWMCKGVGEVNAWNDSFEAPEAEDEFPCQICFGASEFGVSTECVHFYCRDCIKASLQNIISTGQFPAFCPACRSDAVTKRGADRSPLQITAGSIEAGALTFLERRGIIDKEMQFRFLRLQRESTNETFPSFFNCPAGCGNQLQDRDPEFMVIPRGLTEAAGFQRVAKLGKCKGLTKAGEVCGARVCVQCHVLVTKLPAPKADGSWYDHKCPDLDKAEERDAATEALLRGIGKKCPNCGAFILKNGGCNIVMCGTSTHGRLADALKNGGCGYQFDWDSGQPTGSFYIGLNGLPTAPIVGKPQGHR